MMSSDVRNAFSNDTFCPTVIPGLRLVYLVKEQLSDWVCVFLRHLLLGTGLQSPSDLLNEKLTHTCAHARYMHAYHITKILCYVAVTDNPSPGSSPSSRKLVLLLGRDHTVIDVYI